MSDPEMIDAEERALRAEALRLWTEDRARLVFEHPFLATLALHLEIIPVVDERLPTAATDGRAVYVNPYYMKNISESDRRFVLMHEVWHNALLHFRRRGNREARLWNLATDHEINGLLAEAGFKVPRAAIYFSQWAKDGAEEVYERLLNSDVPQATRRSRGDVHLDAGAGPFQHDIPSESIFGPIQGRFDSAYPGRMDVDATTAWPERIAQRWPGRMPAGLKQVLERVLSPVIPWQTILRDFITRSAQGRLQWSPPSRRHVHRGLYVPSRRGDLLRIAVALDTSGSTAADMPRFLGELQGILRAAGRYEVRLLQCDAVVGFDHTFDDTVPIPVAGLPVVGGGGTDFHPVFSRLQSDPPTALVYLTDGFGAAPREAPPYPVLWVLSAGGLRPAPWGGVVHLDSSGHDAEDEDLEAAEE